MKTDNYDLLVVPNYIVSPNFMSHYTLINAAPLIADATEIRAYHLVASSRLGDSSVLLLDSRGCPTGQVSGK